MSDAHWRAVAEQAARLEAEENFSGILRVVRGEQVLLESCHGLANRTDSVRVRLETRFATASLSKMFTAVAVLDAAGRGEVGVHDPVVDVLPPDLRPSTLRPDVTVHHLLSHTSGIADYYEEDEDLPGYQDDYGALWRDRPTYSVRDYVALLPLFADLPPVCPPGEAHHYSNAGYVLLGILLSHVSGLPFIEAVETRVLAPAGMLSSGYPALDEVCPDLAVNYLEPLAEGGPWRTNIYSVPAVGGGDGGAVTTAADVDRFLRTVASGGVWRGVTPEDVLAPRLAAEDRWAPGYGVDVRDDGVFCKDGGDPGVATFARFNPATDTSLVLLANVDWDTVPGIGEVLDQVIAGVDAPAS